MTRVLLNWHLGHMFGWGIVGRNLLCQWANDASIEPVMGQPITPESFGPGDPLQMGRVLPAIARSNNILATLSQVRPGQRLPQTILIDALGNDFVPSDRLGERNVARTIFELIDGARARGALRKYDEALVASNWNADLLEEATGRRAKVIFEAIDPSLFCPAPKSGILDAQKFYVFSGGKVEFRKAQDLVLLAFRQFAATRKDCVLVTAWHSPWPHLSAGFAGRLKVGLEVGANGRLDIGRWVAANGIDAVQVIDLGFVPNAMMPAILREMDVALSPSRAEACTNLPVKEAMACGVPVIAAVNSGMLDLLRDDNCIALRRQTPVVDQTGETLEGWGESDVDEMVAALEFAYDHRAQARDIGLQSRAWLLAHGRTWQAHARELKEWLLTLG